MKSKKTKKALTGSVLALVLCFVMLLGTTFAWFTDTASTGVSAIQSGTLDVALEMKNDDGNWTSIENGELSFVKSAGHENEAFLWEPGCTYALPTVRVVNKGNLALKYKVVVTAVVGETNLAEVLDVLYSDTSIAGEEEGTTLTDANVGTLNSIITSTDADGFAHGKLIGGATSGDITLKLHMQENAGNKYQGKSIEGIKVTVHATQDTVESDSINNLYDAGAEYADVWNGAVGTMPVSESDVYTINSASELAAFAASVNAGNTYAGKTIRLANDIDLNNQKWTPIGLYCTTRTNSTLLHKTFQGTFDGQGHTIYNMVTTDKWGTDEYIIKGAPALFGATGDGASIKNLTVKNALVYGWAAYSYATPLVGSHTSGSLTFENVSVEDSIVSATRYVGGFVGIAGRSNTATTVTFSNCAMKNITMYYVHGNGASNVYGSESYYGVTYVGIDDVVQENITVINEDNVSTNRSDWKYYYYEDFFGKM